MMYPRLPKSIDKRSHLIGILLVLAAVVLWSTVSVGTRLLVQHGGVFSVAFLSAVRLWLAAIIFLVIHLYSVWRSGVPFRLQIRRTGWLFIAAGAVCANYIFYGIGLRYTTAGATSIVSQVNAAATVLLAALLLGERLTKQKVAGMLVALFGVGIVLFQGSSLQDILSSQHFIGNLIEVVAALAWPFYAIGQTKLLQDSQDRHILMPIFVLAALGSTLLLPFTGPLIPHAPTLFDWGVLIFLGLGSTAAAYWLFAAGLQRIQTSEGSMFNVLMPPMALILAHAMLGEPLHAKILIGLSFVVLGLAMIVWHRSHSTLALRRVFRRKRAPAKVPSSSAA